MEAQWVVDRYRLRELAHQHPHWSQSILAKRLGYSTSWVKKWLRRFKSAEPDDDSVFFSKSRAPHTHQKRVSAEVEHRILEIRDEPPSNLKRIPGPLTILYYLHQDEHLKHVYLPRSTRTIWSILDRNQRICRYKRPQPEVEERPEPLTHFQIDFKSNSTVPADPDGKQQHVVETFNVVDKGTSILLAALPRNDYNAETVIEALVGVFLEQGLPDVITFDRDPRFVGSWSMGDFPTPFMKLLMCLRIKLNICPPHRPDKNAFVERYHRSYHEECLAIHRPADLAAVKQCTANYQHHYNFERPNQALSCGNQPPRIAWPELPKRPGLPTMIEADSWLKEVDGQFFKRRVNSSGVIQLGRENYYIGQAFKKQRILLRVQASGKKLQAIIDGQVIKSLPIKGLTDSTFLFEDYLTYIQAEAVSEYRRYWYKKRRL